MRERLDSARGPDFAAKIFSATGAAMLRMFIALLILASAANAQIIKGQNDGSLQEQLLPESLPLTASATAAKVNAFEWFTTVNYTLANNSGMNLYMAIAYRSVSIGSCARIQGGGVTGGLAMLAGLDLSFPTQGGAGLRFVPAGGRVSGTIMLNECEAPNPGFATAPLSMGLLIGKSADPRQLIQVSVSAEAQVRQLRPQ